MSAMEFDQNFDSSGGFNKTSLINSHNNINLNPPNFENDDVITLNVGGIKVFDILTFIKNMKRIVQRLHPILKRFLEPCLKKETKIC
ncbi:hypothetical protein RirG_093570 [Rhizophagus irregularis DAOM 197198w]|uniref:Uncharacterized protein n=1 Tax=Rhizophagus irregularis (strain DAOM 197198w) TaxID=1432141 RepID=A0A015JR32_RHIIW|nr:hypothetical protein RirG_093570 [Rhizophagus irregularis DAOM 197198w]